MFEKMTIFMYDDSFIDTVIFLWFFSVIAIFFYGGKYSKSYKKFRNVTKKSFYDLFENFRIGNEHSLESESITFFYYIHKKKFYEAGDDNYIELGNITFNASINFLKSIVFSFIFFSLIIFFYGELIRG